jgi:hypothetical protein
VIRHLRVCAFESHNQLLDVRTDAITRSTEILARRRHIIPTLDRASCWRQISQITTERDNPVGRDKILRGNAARPLASYIDALGAQQLDHGWRELSVWLGSGRRHVQLNTVPGGELLTVGGGHHAFRRAVGTQKKNSLVHRRLFVSYQCEHLRNARRFISFASRERGRSLAR